MTYTQPGLFEKTFNSQEETENIHEGFKSLKRINFQLPAIKELMQRDLDRNARMENWSESKKAEYQEIFDNYFLSYEQIPEE